MKSIRLQIGERSRPIIVRGMEKDYKLAFCTDIHIIGRTEEADEFLIFKTSKSCVIASQISTTKNEVTVFEVGTPLYDGCRMIFETLNTDVYQEPECITLLGWIDNTLFRLPFDGAELVHASTFDRSNYSFETTFYPARDQNEPLRRRA